MDTKNFSASTTAATFVLELILLSAISTNLTVLLINFQGGILRSLTYHATLAVWGVLVGLYLNTTTGIILSLVHRFVFTFHPNIRKYMENKYTLIGIIIFYLICYITIAFGLWATGSTYYGIRDAAFIASNGALQPFFIESSFVYAIDNTGIVRVFLYIVTAMLMIVSLILLLSIAWFFYSVFMNRKTAIVSRTARSLIASSLILCFLCVMFLLVPIFCLVFFWTFRLKGTANIMNGVATFLSIHATFDTLSTLYFVVPYNRFCKRLIFHPKLPWAKFCKDTKGNKVGKWPVSTFGSRNEL
uniref:G_PROTEIN_RECEP_F1_2 domain-containing protein n=1 Tax=Panagrellus redivivus TaxID=6233 RepID=A0A7E4ZSU4_PANRE